MGGYSFLNPSAAQTALGTGISGLGQSIANIGNASSGIIPSSGTTGATAPAATMPGVKPTGSVMTTPQAIGAMQGPANPANTMTPQVGSGVTGSIPNQPVSTTAPTAASGGTVPSTSSVPVATGAGTINGGDYNSVYGDDTGNAVTSLLNSESTGTANSLAQEIIAANAPNVAQGAATLNTGLAAGGISPSSSVSAIENANYQGQVQQQNTAEIANVSMSEQQMQQQLLEQLLPSQQQRQTDSSGWSIFGDVMSGVGDVIGL